MRLFYLIWSDAILSFKKHNPKMKNWEVRLFLLLSFIFALNSWIVLLWLKFFDLFEVALPTINIFPGRILNSFIGFVIMFVLPFAIINYFLIFYRNRYLYITEKYKNHNTKYALYYCLSILAMTVLSAFLYRFLTR